MQQAAPAVSPEEALALIEACAVRITVTYDSTSADESESCTVNSQKLDSLGADYGTSTNV